MVLVISWYPDDFKVVVDGRVQTHWVMGLRNADNDGSGDVEWPTENSERVGGAHDDGVGSVSWKRC